MYMDLILIHAISSGNTFHALSTHSISYFQERERKGAGLNREGAGLNREGASLQLELEKGYLSERGRNRAFTVLYLPVL